MAGTSSAARLLQLTIREVKTSAVEVPMTAFPIVGVPGLFAASYLNGVNVMGGTGRFAGARGNIKFYGAVDLNQNQVILRYQGEICFAKP